MLEFLDVRTGLDEIIVICGDEMSAIVSRLVY